MPSRSSWDTRACMKHCRKYSHRTCGGGIAQAVRTSCHGMRGWGIRPQGEQGRDGGWLLVEVEHVIIVVILAVEAENGYGIEVVEGAALLLRGASCATLPVDEP